MFWVPPQWYSGGPGSPASDTRPTSEWFNAKAQGSGASQVPSPPLPPTLAKPPVLRGLKGHACGDQRPPENCPSDVLGITRGWE